MDASTHRVKVTGDWTTYLANVAFWSAGRFCIYTELQRYAESTWNRNKCNLQEAVAQKDSNLYTEGAGN